MQASLLNIADRVPAGALATVLLLIAGPLMHAAPAVAQEPSVKLQLQSRETYAGLPFVLSVVGEGFEEEPAPQAPPLEIPGCRVIFQGMTPNVSSMVSIVNGRRTQSRSVTFAYRYRIEATKAGTYTVPRVTLTQGARSASAPGGTFEVKEVATSDDMRLEVKIPERPIYVGETLALEIDWLLRRNVQDQSFAIPVFDEETIHVEPGAAQGRRALAFTAGARDIELPYDRQQVTVGGNQYTRFRFHALITPNRAGSYELAPARVVARLESGTSRDTFGFRVARHELFQADDVARRLSVRPLPQSGRPESFANAIGTSFSIAVQASRTVVQVGDPIQLTIQVRGDGRLEGLALPPLDADGGLDPALFSVPDETATGVISEDGASKTFDVTVRLRSAEASEIPALAFSYFDPEAATYRTVRGQPIALSVRGSAVVGADDVVSGDTRAASPTDDAQEPPASGSSSGFAPGSLVGADLSLSDNGTLARAFSARDVRPFVLLLYLAPLVVLGWRLWHVRTREERGRSSELRRRITDAEHLLVSARSEPARESAPKLLSSLRVLSRFMNGLSPADKALFERIETEGYSPAAAESPLDEAILADAANALRRWENQGLANGGKSTNAPPSSSATTATTRGATVNETSSQAPTPSGRSTMLILVGALAAACALAPPSVSHALDASAADDVDATLGEARRLYREALAEDDRVRRTRIFAESERLFRTIAENHRDSPELLIDWGNAALGAYDLGRATLAYRRALRLAPANERARKNLGWVRGRAPSWLPTPTGRGAVDTLFFWHRALSVAHKQLLGALAFAVAVLLLAPWPIARDATLRKVAIVPLVLWLALAGSAVLDRGSEDAAVVLVDGVELRSADSDGAPPALSAPLPAGTEVTMLESRDTWARVILADGTRGWIKSHTLERVVPLS